MMKAVHLIFNEGKSSVSPAKTEQSDLEKTAKELQIYHKPTLPSFILVG